MFKLTEIVDEYSGKPAVHLRIETDATPEAIEEARAALPESVRYGLRSTANILFTLKALACCSAADRCYIVRFVLP